MRRDSGENHCNIEYREEENHHNIEYREEIIES